MSSLRLLRPSRRDLLVLGLGGGAALAVGVYGGYKLGRRAERRNRVTPPRDQVFAPNAFVAIDEAGKVTIWLGQPDVGQGVATSLTVSVADEMGADPAAIAVVLAPANEAYGSQFTAVSSSVRDHWLEVRRAGAAAREMLVQVAAEGFGCAIGDCLAEGGAVVHTATGRRLPFAALVRAASQLSVPMDPVLKQIGDLHYVGKHMPRPDHAIKVTGAARYGVDVRLPGMKFAVVARPPAIGGAIASFDETAARATPGVVDVFRIESGIVVVADTTYAALRGREALAAKFDAGPHADWSSEKVSERLTELLKQEGAVARRDGNGAETLSVADPAAPGMHGRVVLAEYRLPYLAHATMEPMNCTADVRSDSCLIYAPTQVPQSARDEAANLLSMPRDQVVVQPTWIGGAFGRRVAQDFVREAVLASQAAGCPVQVIWTREDDFAHDHFRPCSLHRMSAQLGEDGVPRSWHHRIVTPSILKQDPRFKDPVDPTAVEGAKDVPYAIADLQVEFVPAPFPFRLGFWRSVGHSFNAFAVESFVDEIAIAAGRDPIELRRTLLSADPANARHLGVLDAAVAAAGSCAVGTGQGRGVAVHASFGSFVAMVIDVHVDGSRLDVLRVTAAVDCGFAVHPDGVRAQIEGAVAFGLSAALYGQMTFDGGRALPSNFHDQLLLRIDRMPRVTVDLINGGPTDGKLGGVGEIGVPPVAPALCNAIANATGVRHRNLPLPFGG